jgi:hypothetical protein
MQGQLLNGPHSNHDRISLRTGSPAKKRMRGADAESPEQTEGFQLAGVTS